MVCTRGGLSEPSACFSYSQVRLAVRSELGADAVLAHLGELAANARREGMCEGHHLGRLIDGVAEHVSLVASASLLRLLVFSLLVVTTVYGVGDLSGLAVEAVERPRMSCSPDPCRGGRSRSP